MFLWENQTDNTNNWLKVRLTGTTSNRMGIGSRIKVFAGEDVYYGYTLCGEGYIAQNSQSEFFGLGDASLVDAVEVHWLSGQVDRIENIAVNQTLAIVEGENPLSVADLSLNTIKTFPNPVARIFTLDKLTTFIGGTLAVYDIHGKLLYTQSIDSETIQLDVATYDTGLYMVQLENASQKYVTRFIKR